MATTTLQLHPAIQRYLTALECSLRKTPGMLPEDGLADAHEFLQSELEALAGDLPPLDDLFRHFVEKFGTPDEVAAAYAAACEPPDNAAALASAPTRTEPIAQATRIGPRLLVRMMVVGVALVAITALGWRFFLGPVVSNLLGPVEGSPTWTDRVVSYSPGNPKPSLSIDPLAALGQPDCRDGNREPQNFVALGRGGQLVLEFTGTALYDGEGPDLMIVEIGPLAEAVDVSVSTDGQEWVEIGQAKGAESTLDLRGLVRPGDRFRFVRLVDLGTVSAAKNQWPGADIDAVGAMHAVGSR